MRNKVIALIFTIAIISFLIITLPATLGQNTNPQQESVSLSTTNNSEDRIISIYENVNYIDSETYSKIKAAYNKLNFNVSFNLGNVEEYGLYKKQFGRLLKNEVMFTKSKPEKSFI